MQVQDPPSGECCCACGCGECSRWLMTIGRGDYQLDRSSYLCSGFETGTSFEKRRVDLAGPVSTGVTERALLFPRSEYPFTAPSHSTSSDYPIDYSVLLSLYYNHYAQNPSTTDLYLPAKEHLLSLPLYRDPNACNSPEVILTLL